MKRAVAFGSFLILFWVFSGVAAAQSLSGLTGPLDEVVDTVTGPVDQVTAPVDKVKEVVDKVTKPVTEALPAPVKDPVDNVVKDVGKTVDSVVNDVTNKAAAPTKNAPGTSVTGGNPSDGPESAQATNRSASGTSATKTKAARTSRDSGKSSRGANRSEPGRDTEQVAAAGNTIEPGEVKGTHIIAPATDVEDSQGSGLSLTGVQILTWLILACLLMGAGAALFQGGRTRLRTARS